MLLHEEAEDEEEDEESDFIPHVTFSYNFLHAVTFLHVLHLDVLRGQIEIDANISLCMAIMLDHPWQSL